MEINTELIKKAYKKLKSSVYFDKTQLPLRDQIVAFESNKNNFDQFLEELWDDIQDEERWSEMSEEILSSISVISLPKKLKPDEQTIIINSVDSSVHIEDLQHFIKMDVRGHIIGVLWLLMIGWKLDETVYEHSYGNRLRKTLVNEMSDGATFSPYLFEPYFEQYESWRDTALTYAQKCLGKSQDVVIITMDFCRFYYSVDITKEAFDNILDHLDCDELDDPICKRIHDFVFETISVYSKQYFELLSIKNENENKNIIPIGYLPSNVLANWCLEKFDKAVIDGWNPVYYGRYVDDIIIVDKVEKNSEIYKRAKNRSLTQNDIIEYFLEQCSRWKGFIPPCNEKSNYGLLVKDKESKDKNKSTYYVNSTYNISENSRTKITIQNDKVKVFYFNSGETDALIKCFKKQIAQNASEFRLMPEDDAVFHNNDYSDIYILSNSDTINKLRGVDGVSIDKFELSKFLGKYLRIGNLVNDKIESNFEKDIAKIFNTKAIIENYTAWEKVIEIFVIESKYDELLKFISNIITTISNIEYEPNEKIILNIQKSMVYFLRSGLTRAFSLNWGNQSNNCIEKISELIKCDPVCRRYTLQFSKERLNKKRRQYCVTRMNDKYVMPVLIDAFIMDNDFMYDDNTNINLTKFNDVIDVLSDNEITPLYYIYYPYMVNMFDLSMIYTMKDLLSDETECLKTNINLQQNDYALCNYNIRSDVYNEVQKSIQVKIFNENEFNENCNYIIKVGNDKKDQLKIAIANVELFHKNFEKVVKDQPNRTYDRYRDLALIINQAIKGKADILVMPESFVPFEWLSHIARTAAKNQLAIITGIEHIKVNSNVFNYTAVILPYTDGTHNTALITFHLKKHYAPHEIQQIKGYRLEPVKGNHYELYCWNDCWFPVYCCYELSSIHDRSIFLSYLDMLVAVEWNQDTNYYSNIIESLSRDLHCYCVQVNSSNYGDSRITIPSKTENKDVIRTKGGKNSIVLIDNINIASLRDFQFMEYELQRKTKIFKPTPPELNKRIVEMKMKGELWEYLINLSSE